MVRTLLHPLKGTVGEPMMGHHSMLAVVELEGHQEPRATGLEWKPLEGHLKEPPSWRQMQVPGGDGPHGGVGQPVVQ